MRLVYLVAGLVSVVLGLIGIALPLLPTVPFMILAAFCFSRSSPRFEAWLVGHKVFGPHIRDWRQRGAISARGKRAATIAIAVVIAISLLFGVPVHVLGIQLVVLGAVMAFIWTRPAA